jgi:hypothetical protein
MGLGLPTGINIQPNTLGKARAILEQTGTQQQTIESSNSKGRATNEEDSVVIFSFNTGTRVHCASMSAVRRMTGTLDRQPTQLMIYTHP